MKKYNIAVVGAGIVGKKMVEILVEREFPYESMKILATSKREETIAGKTFMVEETTEESFDNIDIALFAGTEGEKGASALFGWTAVKKGAFVIDNGGDFRMDDRVPLVIPEVNPHQLNKSNGFIANPNCSTIQMVLAVSPLYKKYGIKRIFASTYQAVSGTGRSAIEELERQVKSYTDKETVKSEVYPYQISFNVIPQIGSLSDEFPGYYTEEVKMIKETRKILESPDLQISATCVRIPVFNGHSETLTVQCEKNFDLKEVRELLSSHPGIKVLDEPENSMYPVPFEVSGKDEVFIGRIRKNPALENTMDMWVVSDNIRKGAALNTVQIAEKLVELNIV